MKPKTLQCFSFKNYSHLLGFGTHYLTLFEYKLVLYSIHPCFLIKLPQYMPISGFCQTYIEPFLLSILLSLICL